MLSGTPNVVPIAQAPNTAPRLDESVIGEKFNPMSNFDVEQARHFLNTLGDVREATGDLIHDMCVAQSMQDTIIKINEMLPESRQLPMSLSST